MASSTNHAQALGHVILIDDDASVRRSVTTGIGRFIDTTTLVRYQGSKGTDDSRARLARGSVRFIVGFTGRACRDPSRLFR